MMTVQNLNYSDFNILIVDDMPLNLSVVVDYLEEFGFGIRIARSGESALQRIQYDQPDLVLLDVLMSGIDGFETCRRLKADPKTRDIPIIFMTALASPEDKVRGFEVGAVDYVTKPLSHEEVLARITTHLRLRELTLSLQEQTRQLEERTSIEKARLFQAVAQQRDQLRALTGKLTQVQETERKQLAQELHDELGQMLTAISINLGTIQQELGDDGSASVRERLDESYLLVEQMLEQVRELSLNLRPPMLDDLGLVPTLRWYVQRYAERSNIAVQLDVADYGERLTSDVETTIYRVLQEALTNIARHAGAQKVLVRLHVSDSTIRAYVDDDGCGFDVATVMGRTVDQSSAGLLGMRERVTIMGGAFTMQSDPGAGTQLSFVIPREAIL